MKRIKKILTIIFKLLVVLLTFWKNDKNSNINNKNKKRKLNQNKKIIEIRLSQSAKKHPNTFRSALKLIIKKVAIELTVIFRRLNTLFLPDSAGYKKVKIDKLLFTMMWVLSLIGFICLYSAYMYRIFVNSSFGIINIEVFKQLIFFILSWFIFIIVAKKVNIYWLKEINYLFLLVFLGLVGITILLGSKSNTSARRWINLGFFTFQSAEVGKIIFPIVFAYLLTLNKLNTMGNFFKSWFNWFYFVPILLSIFIVFKLMPDTGTTIAFAFIFLAALSVAKTTEKFQSRFIALLVTIFIVVAIGVIVFPDLATKVFTTSKFQGNRITTFLNPFKNKDDGYQLVSSLVAIAKGSIFGSGLGNGTQKLGWLPESESDFIFSNVAEELGLVGVLVICVLFLTIFLHLYKKIIRMNDDYLRIMSFSLLIGIYINILINIGGISAAIPLSGVPLPFFSSGVTNLLSTFISFGLIQNAINISNASDRGTYIYESLTEVSKVRKLERRERKILTREKKKREKTIKKVRVKKGEKIKANGKNVKIRKVKKRDNNGK